jgi:hypothetical protein
MAQSAIAQDTRPAGLLALCQTLDVTCVQLDEATTVLDTYLTVGRYPDRGPDPTPAPAAQALPWAEQVLEFVAARLPSSD